MAVQGWKCSVCGEFVGAGVAHVCVAGSTTQPLITAWAPVGFTADEKETLFRELRQIVELLETIVRIRR